MKLITTDQKKQIQQILTEGKYHDDKSGKDSTHIQSLYQAFITYCQYRNIGKKCWKIRYFRHPPQKPQLSRYDPQGGIYKDIPMNLWQIRLAVVHGQRQGDIEQVNAQQGKHNRRVYRFIDKTGDGK